MFKQKTTRLQQGSFFVFVEYIKSDLIYFYILLFFSNNGFARSPTLGRRAPRLDPFLFVKVFCVRMVAPEVVDIHPESLCALVMVSFIDLHYSDIKAVGLAAKNRSIFYIMSEPRFSFGDFRQN